MAQPNNHTVWSRFFQTGGGCLAKCGCKNCERGDFVWPDCSGDEPGCFTNRGVRIKLDAGSLESNPTPVGDTNKTITSIDFTETELCIYDDGCPVGRATFESEGPNGETIAYCQTLWLTATSITVGGGWRFWLSTSGAFGFGTILAKWFFQTPQTCECRSKVNTSNDFILEGTLGLEICPACCEIAEKPDAQCAIGDQGTGLCKWMPRCISVTLSEWQPCMPGGCYFLSGEGREDSNGECKPTYTNAKVTYYSATVSACYQGGPTRYTLAQKGDTRVIVGQVETYADCSAPAVCDGDLIGTVELKHGFIPYSLAPDAPMIIGSAQAECFDCEAFRQGTPVTLKNEPPTTGSFRNFSGGEAVPCPDLGEIWVGVLVGVLEGGEDPDECSVATTSDPNDGTFDPVPQFEAVFTTTPPFIEIVQVGVLVWDVSGPYPTYNADGHWSRATIQADCDTCVACCLQYLGDLRETFYQDGGIITSIETEDGVVTPVALPATDAAAFLAATGGEIYENNNVFELYCFEAGRAVTKITGTNGAGEAVVIEYDYNADRCPAPCSDPPAPLTRAPLPPAPLQLVASDEWAAPIWRELHDLHTQPEARRRRVLEALAGRIPCGECKLETLRKVPSLLEIVDEPNALQIAMIDWHNEINVKKGKPVYSPQ